MKMPSILAAGAALLATTAVHAIDAEYRRLLERSGCTQVSEAQGCDINKTKQENAKAGFVSDTAAHTGGAAAAHSGGHSGTRVAEQACLEAVAKTVGQPRSTLSVVEVLPAEAGIGVTIQVPGATAPWSCLSDAKGHVQGTMFTGKDGD